MPAQSTTPLALARQIMGSATDVAIDPVAATRLASIIGEVGTPLKWGAPYPTCADGSTPAEVIAFALTVSSLNFYFWSPDLGPRWQVQGVTGAYGLAGAFAGARNDGIPVTSPEWLVACDEKELERVLHGDEGGAPLPPLHGERSAILNELGRWLSGFPDAAIALGEHADAFAGAVYLGESLEEFADPFLKRAQLAIYGIGDLLGDAVPEWILDRRRLTAMADYRVPQVLRHFRVLNYSTKLADIVDGEVLLPKDSSMELEIRAGTLIGVEAVCKALGEAGTPMDPSDLDGLLWKAAKKLDGMAPHHRTPTIWY